MKFMCQTAVTVDYSVVFNSVEDETEIPERIYPVPGVPELVS